MKTIDPILLQRLIDGECSQSETQQLLRNATECPGDWQSIATAFVENQLWEKEFSMPSSPHTNSKLTDSKSAAAKPEQAAASVAKSPGSIISRLSSQPKLNWLAIAAGTFVAAMGGYMVGNFDDLGVSSRQQNLQPMSNLVTEERMNSDPLREPQPSADSSVDQMMIPEIADTHPDISQIRPADYHMQLFDENGKAAGLDSEIPLYQVNSSDQLKQLPNPNQERWTFAPKFVDQLSGNGFQMDENVSYISGRLKDGRHFMIPVRTLNFSKGQ